MPRHSWPKHNQGAWRQCLNCECQKAEIRSRANVFQLYHSTTFYRLGGKVFTRAPECLALSPLELDIRRYVRAEKAELGI